MVILETLNILWKNWTACVVCDISGATVGLELNVWDTCLLFIDILTIILCQHQTKSLPLY